MFDFLDILRKKYENFLKVNFCQGFFIWNSLQSSCQARDKELISLEFNVGIQGYCIFYKNFFIYNFLFENNFIHSLIFFLNTISQDRYLIIYSNWNSRKCITTSTFKNNNLCYFWGKFRRFWIYLFFTSIYF